MKNLTNQIWIQFRNQVRDQVRVQVGEQIGGEVRDRVGGEIRGQVKSQVLDKVWCQVLLQKGVIEMTNLIKQVHDYVKENVRDSCKLSSKVNIQFWTQVRDTDWPEMSIKIWGQLDDLIDIQINKSWGQVLRNIVPRP